MSDSSGNAHCSLSSASPTTIMPNENRAIFFLLSLHLAAANKIVQLESLTTLTLTLERAKWADGHNRDTWLSWLAAH